jgi:hypothetical protein
VSHPNCKWLNLKQRGFAPAGWFALVQGRTANTSFLDAMCLSFPHGIVDYDLGIASRGFFEIHNEVRLRLHFRPSKCAPYPLPTAHIARIAAQPGVPTSLLIRGQ